MRLKHIKLAGFKSFVDPTTIHFTKDMTGIIGPNGCGKSNTIDAVRWVMGESSAKQLRGESMDDVIFKGSSSRSGVSRASVELVFDNTEQKLVGQYAEYNEIAVKREVTKDGSSNYYLNGARCRRRDISDIFLGTGLGPRSYAIIEQGMISRVIEAKPEELRVYLEEAAGISKYKERRRETENRIRHTRDNLDRLNDLREEVEKQLRTLERQSKQAEKYKEFKGEEARKKAELLALQWQTYNEKVKTDQQEIDQQVTKVEAETANLRHVETDIEKARQDSQKLNDALAKVQGEFYEIGSEISKAEQNIRHHQDMTQRIEQDLAQLEKSTADARQAIEEDQAKIIELDGSVATQAPELEMLQATEQESTQMLFDAEKGMREWQQQWDTFNVEFSKTEQQLNVEKTRIQQLSAQTERAEKRQERLLIELDTCKIEGVDELIKELVEAESGIHNEVEQNDAQLEELGHQISALRETLQNKSTELDELNKNILEDRGEYTSLDALQKAALGKTDDTSSQWLQRNHLANASRLAEELKVDSGWEVAVETVLGANLEAVCLDDNAAWSSLADSLTNFDGGVLTLLRKSSGMSDASSEKLSSKVSANFDLSDLLDNVYIAEDLSSALSMQARLKNHESIVTKDGIWLGQHWLRVQHKKDDHAGVLARKQKIEVLEARIDVLSENKETIQHLLDSSKEELAAKEEQRESLRLSTQSLHQKLSEKRSQLTQIKSRFEQSQQRSQAIQTELSELNSQLENDQSILQKAQSESVGAEQQITQQQARREQLIQQRDEVRQSLEASRQEAQRHKDASHKIAMTIQAMRTQKDSTGQNLERMQRQIEQLESRKQDLVESRDRTHAPVEAMQKALEEAVEKRNSVDKRLAEARASTDAVDKQLRENEGQRNTLTQRIQEMQHAVEQARMMSQENKVRRQTTEERLNESEFSREQLVEEMPEEANVEAWNQQVEQLGQKISRLGNINLLAIDELKEQAERKEYLDAQFTDLTSALETLEDAIAKIDKETRSRFKEVYDQVNAQISKMFPRLFGGGQAHLELTGNDLLSTGVSIMARPPGKRVSNIHLLSGGEKALTAVAMVFAIFQLNPAPFCMLDEVDAPLDEANVGRFCELVREMSKKVQFVIITHNKTTMELSDQLMGVTMRESGVSRIVSVDIDEAVDMVAS